MLTIIWASSKLSSLITDHQNKYNDEKAWKVGRITRMWNVTETQSKMTPMDMSTQGCHKNTVSVKGNKAKGNKTRPAYNLD